MNDYRWTDSDTEEVLEILNARIVSSRYNNTNNIMKLGYRPKIKKGFLYWESKK